MLIISSAGDEQRRDFDLVGVGFDGILRQKVLGFGLGHATSTREAIEEWTVRSSPVRRERASAPSREVDDWIASHVNTGSVIQGEPTATHKIPGPSSRPQRAQDARRDCHDNTDASRVYLWQCLGKSDARDDIVMLLAEERSISGAIADRQMAHGCSLKALIVGDSWFGAAMVRM